MIESTKITTTRFGELLEREGEYHRLKVEVERLQRERGELVEALKMFLFNHDEDRATAGDSDAGARNWTDRLAIADQARALLDRLGVPNA